MGVRAGPSTPDYLWFRDVGAWKLPVLFPTRRTTPKKKEKKKEKEKLGDRSCTWAGAVRLVAHDSSSNRVSPPPPFCFHLYGRYHQWNGRDVVARDIDSQQKHFQV